ncbi:MAG: AsmA family protein [Prolixibacteraceae bacterium]|jgi:uncharacterized protein involved in outer membrane biogenesis|nr:AsmA family protein [Prolixibacteraceae bacterium]MBT7000057.1 AsmA family protein [Prolixibacteraceae bacterium]MBT7394379.1 AsmA family protein [Prolixibacteraceae bacterium]
MRRTILIIGIVLVVLLATLFSIPVFFKSMLLEKTKSTINKQVNAEVEFAGFNMSLFRNFPKVTIEMSEVVISGRDEFQSDTLLNVTFIRAKMSLLSLFDKTGMSIEEINLIQPELKLVVGKSGNANWDLAAGSGSDSELSQAVNTAGDDKESSFELQLEKIEIKNATLVYDDRELNMLLDFSDINVDIAGKMYGTSTELLANGKVENFSLEYENMNYISNTSLETKTLLNVDYDKMDISILENELLVNRLPMEITGTIKMPSDSIFFDLKMKTKESGFDNFLALVPPDYEDYLKDIKTSGSASVFGTVEGLFFNEIYPAFSFGLDVKNGNFQYTDLPEEIKNIKADVSISKPQGILDLTEIKIKEAHAEIKNNPVDLTLTLNNLVSDPYFDGAFIGKINFDHLRDALPIDSVSISGIVDANLFVKGNYSAIENEQYDKIKSDGIVMLDNFFYDSPDLTQKILIPKGNLDFSPENVNLREFNMRIGQSDFNLYGKVSNYLNYILKDGTLKGDLQLISSSLNLNELLRLQVIKETADQENTQVQSPDANTFESGETEVLVFDIPKNIDVTFRSNIKNAIFDHLPISDINGLISARNGKLMLNGLNMKMLDGELKLTGSYENSEQNQPFFDFGFHVTGFDIPLAYQSLTGIQKMLPGAGKSQGKFSTNLNLNGQLNQELKMIATSVDGTGFFNTENLQIIDSRTFDQLKGILKAEKLKNVMVDDFIAHFVVSDGNLLLKPFSTKVAGQETNVTGSLNAQNLVDMRLDFNVEREAFGPDIQNILSVLPGQERIKLIPASVVIKGPVGNPEVKMDLSEARKTIADEVKRSTKQELQNSLNKLGQGLKKLFDK